MVQLTPNTGGLTGVQRSETMDSQTFVDAPETPTPTSPRHPSYSQDVIERQRSRLERSAPSTMSSIASVPPPGSILTGKQEHYLKRELLATQTSWEVAELSSPTALQRFGAPFRSDAGEVAPEDSELPLLRYIFVHHVRNFPFLNQAKEKEFWQDKLQSFLESFANKHISSSEDRLEQTKRAKLAGKATKLVELMMHAEFLLRVKRKDQPEVYVARRFGQFAQMHKRLRLELPGKVLPPLPRKNKAQSIYSGKDEVSDDESIDSFSTQDVVSTTPTDSTAPETSSAGGIRGYLSSWTGGSTPARHSRAQSRGSLKANSPRASLDASSSKSLRGASPAPPKAEQQHVLIREDQRVSLRAFLRHFLANEAIAASNAMTEFLTHKPVSLTPDEMADIERRKAMDEKRLEEQHRFFEIARERARELDVHMELFRRKVIERNGLRDLFSEIKRKERIADLDPEYKKFAEWLRIEVAATLYHLFLAEDNSPDLFAQAKRIHGLVPYGALKQVIRFTNPAAVMVAVLDLFMAQPLGAKSLLQRIFGFALGDGMRALQKSIDALTPKIEDEIFARKVEAYTNAEEDVKRRIRAEAIHDQVDLLVKVLQSSEVEPELSDTQIGEVFNAYVAWDNAIENVNAPEMRQGAELYAHLKQLLKLHTRMRDKKMMLAMVEESTTLRLFRDLFTIFYEPLVRVYKSANVYNSVTDFARFADDAISVIEKAQRQDGSADPNQTVQAFIDLCERHEEDLYKFIHEVHLHDNGLFDKLMTWIEGILDFLRNGPRDRDGVQKKLDMNALFADAVEMGVVDGEKCVREVNSLIKWQMARKKWHSDKTRLKMASGPAGDTNGATGALASTFKPGDFGIDAMDLQDLDMGDEDDDPEDMSSDEDVEDDGLDPIEAERRRRKRNQDVLRRSAGEPIKPAIKELPKMMDGFIGMLRGVLAE
ncbi:hypothetical protein LTR27_006335 [Elasticomyces elasticus]|nr:hypothetical protein LTR27_006335 [Elasticomyces elasticus]